MIEAIGNLFGYAMYGCYYLFHNYGVSIIIFTFLSKLVLMPISVMVQKNSIKMVEMYPELNRIKAKFFGSKDLISEAQYELYKKNHYHPTLDLIPVLFQLILLMGVVDVIYRPLNHIFHLSQDVIDGLIATYCRLSGAGIESGSIQLQVLNSISLGLYSEEYKQIVSQDVLSSLASLDMHFCGINLGNIPVTSGGIMILVPILAALSSLLMCYCQNVANVLQSEQSKMNQWTTLTISVALSLYLGFFVPAGVGMYWIISNLIAILTLFLLNYLINPKNYIDYQALAQSREELDKVLKYQSASKQMKRSSEEIALEKRDYKRFFKYPNKQLVFYSEKNGFYKYFKNVIEYILEKTDITIHYITGDSNDEVRQLENDHFHVYYIGENKLILLMMRLEADVVVMTMPDLQKYHIKRSMVKNDIEYIYIDHGIGSDNMTLRKHALDYFDTIFASNEIGKREMKAQDEVYGLKPRTIVEFGSCLIDDMIEMYREDRNCQNERKTILIAPSWQDHNILDSCIDEILEQLLPTDYRVIVRPHPQYVRHFREKLDELALRYSQYDNFLLEIDFSSNETVYHADLLITDWSSIAFEYSFCTLRPTLFINTPMKVMNPDYEEIGVVPFDIEIRDKIGLSIELTELNLVEASVNKLLTGSGYVPDEMEKIRSEYLYNIGTSGEVGARYIIKRLIFYSKK